MANWQGNAEGLAALMGLVSYGASINEGGLELMELVDVEDARS